MRWLPQNWRQSPEHWPWPAQGLGALLLGGLLLLATGPLWLNEALGAWRAACLAEDELHQQVQGMAQSNATLDDWRAHHRQLLETLEGLQQRLPGEAELPAMLARLEQLAQAQGLQLLKVQVLDAQSRDTHLEQSLQVQLRGDYHSLTRWLAALAEPSLGLHATGLSLQPVAGEGEGLDIHLQLLSQRRSGEVP